MNSIIKASLNRGISYEVFRNRMLQWRLANATSGHEQSESHKIYTKLNERRMKRWDKTLKIKPSDLDRFLRLDLRLTWLVLAESWCADGAHIIPVLNKLAVLHPNIDLKIVFRDENPELMDAFLTNGNRAIPKVIMIDRETAKVIATYGPHPSEVSGYVKRFMAINGTLTSSFKEDVQYWYNNDKGQTIIKDILQILGRLQPSVSL